jgi:hypothetical protein
VCKAHKEIKELPVQEQQVQVAQPAPRERKDLLEQLVQAQPVLMELQELPDCLVLPDFKVQQVLPEPPGFGEPLVFLELPVLAQQVQVAQPDQPGHRVPPDLLVHQA